MIPFKWGHHLSRVLLSLSTTASWLHFLAFPEFPYIHYLLNTYFLLYLPPQSVLWASIDIIVILWWYVMPIWTLTDYFAYINCFWLVPGVCVQRVIFGLALTHCSSWIAKSKIWRRYSVLNVSTHSGCLWTIYRKFEQLALQLVRVLETIQSTLL